MPATTLVLILGAVAFSATGQLFLKTGTQHVTAAGQIDFLLASARDWHVIGGVVALAASTLCWLYVLRVAPLSRAYLMASLTYVVVPIASTFLFGEQLRRVQVVGMLLIVGGIACLIAGD